MFEEKKITVEMLDGRVVDCDVIASFECTQNGKNYVIYTDNEVDTNGKVVLYAGIYLETEDGPTFMEIGSDEEWQMVEEFLDQLVAGFQNDNNDEY